MLTDIRYALTTICFAASVGCLALWWRSVEIEDAVFGTSFRQGEKLIFESKNGSVQIASMVPVPVRPQSTKQEWRTFSHPIQEVDDREASPQVAPKRFQLYSHGLSFPLWYTSLIFALAGVGVLRFRRQFSIRSALVSLTVVAALLGMAVTL